MKTKTFLAKAGAGLSQTSKFFGAPHRCKVVYSFCVFRDSSTSKSPPNRPLARAPQNQRVIRKLREFDPIDEESSTPVFISQQAKFPIGMKRQERFQTEGNEMELVFLGTASCIPSFTRGVSCTGLRYIGDWWLFDCGESSQLQLQKSQIGAADISKIFISHLHGDHFFGIPAVLAFLGKSSATNPDKIIDIYGPEGIRDYIRSTLLLSCTKNAVKHRIHELKQLRSGLPFQPPNFKVPFSSRSGEIEGGRDIYPSSSSSGSYYELIKADGVGLSVKAANMVHTIPCVGFVVEEPTRPGRLVDEFVMPIFMKHLSSLKAIHKEPMTLLKEIKKLQPEQRFTFPDGSYINAEDAVKPAMDGRKLVIMGDTCSGEYIADIAMDADVLVHEATNSVDMSSVISDSSYLSSLQDVNRATFDKMHSTPQMAGRFAAQIRAKQLILTHFSNRYFGDDSMPAMKIMWHIEDQARSTSKLLSPNDVVAAWDFMSLNIPRRIPKRYLQ